MRNNVRWRWAVAVILGLVAGSGGSTAASATEVTTALPPGCLAHARGQTIVACLTDVSTATTPPRALAPTAADPTVPCLVNAVSKDRFHACVANRYQYDLILVPEGTLVGTSMIQITQASELRQNSRTWRHVFTLDVEAAAGLLASGVIIRPTLTCDGLCEADEFTTGRTVRVGDPATVTFHPEVEGNSNVETRQTVGVTFSSGATTRPSGQTAALTPLPMVRCDVSDLFGSTRGGCVYPEFEPTFTLSLSDDRVNESAAHIRDAQLASTHRWGLQPSGTKLRRTTSDTNIDANRRAACPPSLPRPTGKSCDEYPFASTSQGAAMEGAGDFSRRMVDARDNSRAGSDLGRFYRTNRILGNDAFWVKITTG